ncbi:MAG: recombination protein RecR [Pseudomonadales bacterium]|nr:recombination protein RecR [Pseudomonadales bacterium]
MSVIDNLISALQVLPGVGPKSAQRMTLFLLQAQRPGGLELATALTSAMQEVRECSVCRNFTEAAICRICNDGGRDPRLLCIVESPADVLAFETAGGFSGRYFVLHGKLSPLDGIGPEDLGLVQLGRLIQGEVDGAADGDKNRVEEVILATNPNVEGEATAHYIVQMLSAEPVVVSRIAHGVPLGGEIEYTDGGTLAHALQGRRNIG